jgi:hypothetical protein
MKGGVLQRYRSAGKRITGRTERMEKGSCIMFILCSAYLPCLPYGFD